MNLFLWKDQYKLKQWNSVGAFNRLVSNKIRISFLTSDFGKIFLTFKLRYIPKNELLFFL